RRRFSSSNGTVAVLMSAMRIIAKNSRSVVCEMSTMLAFASARSAETVAMMPTLSWPMTVTMMRFEVGCMRRLGCERCERYERCEGANAAKDTTRANNGAADALV